MRRVHIKQTITDVELIQLRRGLVLSAFRLRINNARREAARQLSMPRAHLRKLTLRREDGNQAVGIWMEFTGDVAHHPRPVDLCTACRVRWTKHTARQKLQ